MPSGGRAGGGRHDAFTVDGRRPVVGRDFYHLIERQEIDPNYIPGAVVRLTSTPGGPSCPPPLFGQHTDEVLRELLGLSDEELATLEADGVTSRQPSNQSWR